MEFRLKRLVLASYAILMLTTLSYASNKWTGKVIGVTDGDTTTVLRKRTQAAIRLYEIDCPEDEQP